MALQTYPTLNDHIALAKFAHFKERDLAGQPYIAHPLRVLEAGKGRGARPFELSAAVLHDVVENTAFSIDILGSLGVPEPVLILVDLLSFDKNKMTLDEYYALIKENEFARAVKLDDITDNMLEWRRNYLSPERQARLGEKYAHAREALGA